MFAYPSPHNLVKSTKSVGFDVNSDYRGFRELIILQQNFYYITYNIQLRITVQTINQQIKYILVEFSEQCLRISFLRMNIEILLPQTLPPALPEQWVQPVIIQRSIYNTWLLRKCFYKQVDQPLSLVQANSAPWCHEKNDTELLNAAEDIATLMATSRTQHCFNTIAYEPIIPGICVCSSPL